MVRHLIDSQLVINQLLITVLEISYSQEEKDMQKILYKMKFIIMISENFNDCLYILFCSHETHTHSSSFSSKALQAIIMKIVEIIQ